MYGQGISRTGEVLDLATDLGVIKKSGSWLSYNDQKLGQGRDNVKELLKASPDLMKEIEAQILEHKDEINTSEKKSKKDKIADAANEAAASAAEKDEAFNDSSVINTDDILADIDEDFEEFTPAEE